MYPRYMGIELDSYTGHSAVLHGCTVEDESFVGTGATLLDGVVVETRAMVAPGALVRQNTRIPSGEVLASPLNIYTPYIMMKDFDFFSLMLNFFANLFIAKSYLPTWWD